MKFRLLFATLSIVGVYAARHVQGQEPSPSGNAYCPVTPEERAEARFATDYGGRTLYFCCGKCRKKFLANPGLYEANLLATDIAAHGATAHNHSGHHADTDGSVMPVMDRLAGYLGAFHPVAVHFPVALLFLAGLGEIVNVRRQSTDLAAAVGIALRVGAVTALLAAGLGWLNAEYGGDSPLDASTLYWHRWSGVAVVVTSSMAALCANRHMNPLRRVLLVLSALLVVVTGYLGGELVFGAGHLAPPF